jgi:hypothetical protein
MSDPNSTNNRRKRALEFATYRDVKQTNGGFLLPQEVEVEEREKKHPRLEQGPEIGLDGEPLYRYNLFT